jgi:hypothetical protein
MSGESFPELMDKLNEEIKNVEEKFSLLSCRGGASVDFLEHGTLSFNGYELLVHHGERLHTPLRHCNADIRIEAVSVFPSLKKAILEKAEKDRFELKDAIERAKNV